jgi:hypothetical protein
MTDYLENKPTREALGAVLPVPVPERTDSVFRYNHANTLDLLVGFFDRKADM